MSDERDYDKMFRDLAEKAVEPHCPCCGGEFLTACDGDDPHVFTEKYFHCGKCGKIPIHRGTGGRYFQDDPQTFKPPFKTIESSSNVRSGVPCLKGTRLPISRIIAELAESENPKTAMQIADDFGLDPSMVHEALMEVAMLFEKPFW